MRLLPVLIALVAWPAAAVPAAAAGVDPTPCTRLALSPSFGTDGRALCAGLIKDDAGVRGVAVFASSDRGMTWQRATGTGLAPTTNDRLEAVFYAPADSGGRIAVVQLRRAGIFVSVDDGKTFALVSPVGLGRLTAVAESVAGVRRTSLLQAHSEGQVVDASLRIDPVLRTAVPVPGTPAADLGFAVSPTYDLDGLAFEAGWYVDPARPTVGTTIVYRCAIGFGCADERFRGPVNARLDGIWVMPTGAARHVVVRKIEYGYAQLWRSTDGGATFAVWPSVDKLLRAQRKHSAYRVAVAPDSPRAGRWYLRVSWTGDAANARSPDADRVYRSDDDGKTWRVVASVRMDRSLRPRGNLPWTNPTEGPFETGDGYLQVGAGRVFVMSGITGGGYVGPLCSTNGGRTWSRRCR